MIVIMMGEFASAFVSLPGRIRSLDAGETLFRQGDPVASVFCIIDGDVRLVRNGLHGEVMVAQRARAGAILAEASVYARNYHCSAEAAASSRLHVVALSAFCARCSDDRAFAAAWAHRLAASVQEARRRAELLSLPTVSRRLEAWLAWNTELPARGAWKGLAEEIGVTPEALYREMARRRLSR